MGRDELYNDSWDVDTPAKRCENCAEYDGYRCMKEWNNLDPSYYIDWRDDKEPDETCEDFIPVPGVW